MLLISKKLAKVIRAGAKMFSMPVKGDENRSFSEKEKTNGHRLTHKAYQLGKSKQICGIFGPIKHQRTLTSLPGDENWKRTKKSRKRGCSTFLKLILLRQIFAVAAFKQFQLVVTWLMIVAGL